MHYINGTRAGFVAWIHEEYGVAPKGERVPQGEQMEKWPRHKGVRPFSEVQSMAPWVRFQVPLPRFLQGFPRKEFIRGAMISEQEVGFASNQGRV
jgi:hypothetical protein